MVNTTLFLNKYPNLVNGVFIIDCQNIKIVNEAGIDGFGNITKNIFGFPDELTTVWNVFIKGAPSLEDINTSKLVIITGSTNDTRDDFKWMKDLKKLLCILSSSTDKYIFGTCFGHQLLAESLGGKVEYNKTGEVEFGSEVLTKTKDGLNHPLLSNIPDNFVINESHGDSVTQIPENSKLLASSLLCENQIVEFTPNTIGIQGHLEFTNSFMYKFLGTSLCQNWLLKKGKSQKDIDILRLSFLNNENESYSKQIRRNLLIWANGNTSIKKESIKNNNSMVIGGIKE